MTVDFSDIIVPSSPEDLKDIFAVMKDISNSKTREQAEKDYQKETFKALQEKYGIKAKHFRRMAKDYHKDQFDRQKAESEAYADLYEAVTVKGKS
jgi:hypothetical protein